MPPSPEERERLLTKFACFCEIESPSGNERAMADAVIAELRALRLEEVEEDDSGAETGSNAGNLFARVPGPRAPGRSCSAPTWTRSARRAGRGGARGGDLPQPQRGDPRRRQQGRSGTILAAVRHLVHTRTPVGVELLFTTSEEPGSAGPRPSTSSGFAPSTASSSTTLRPSVQLVVAAPTYYKVEADFRGAAAHAGIKPENGRNAIAAAAKAIEAMPLGRIDDETTANVGRIDGGTAANVVAERCHVELETRSLGDDWAGDMVGRLVDVIAEAASDAECDVETSVQRQFRAYRLSRTAPVVEAASAALRGAGIEPVYRARAAAATPTRWAPPGSRCSTSRTAPSATTSPTSR